MQAQTKFLVKGMVCERCITVVKTELEKLGMVPLSVSLGEVTVVNEPEDPAPIQFEKQLMSLGFGLLQNKNNRIVEELKSLVATVYSGSYDFPHNFRFSALVTQQFNREYDKLSSIFRMHENTTLERFIIDYKIKKIKDFLAGTNLTLLDISIKLNYNSVAHLSRQFKQFAGITPSDYRMQLMKSSIPELKRISPLYKFCT